MYSKNIVIHEKKFWIGGWSKKIQPLEVAHIRVLISHWLRNLANFFSQFHDSQPFSFPKWYDTWKSGQNWGCYEQKREEQYFFWNFLRNFKNFRGLFGALKLKIFLKKRYFWVTLDRPHLILRSKTKLKKLPHQVYLFVP